MAEKAEEVRRGDVAGPVNRLDKGFSHSNVVHTYSAYYHNDKILPMIDRGVEKGRFDTQIKAAERIEASFYKLLFGSKCNTYAAFVKKYSEFRKEHAENLAIIGRFQNKVIQRHTSTAKIEKNTFNDVLIDMNCELNIVQDENNNEIDLTKFLQQLNVDEYFTVSNISQKRCKIEVAINDEAKGEIKAVMNKVLSTHLNPKSTNMKAFFSHLDALQSDAEKNAKDADLLNTFYKEVLISRSGLEGSAEEGMMNEILKEVSSQFTTNTDRYLATNVAVSKITGEKTTQTVNTMFKFDMSEILGKQVIDPSAQAAFDRRKKNLLDYLELMLSQSSTSGIDVNLRTAFDKTVQTNLSTPRQYALFFSDDKNVNISGNNFKGAMGEFQTALWLNYVTTVLKIPTNSPLIADPLKGRQDKIDVLLGSLGFQSKNINFYATKELGSTANNLKD